MLIPKQPVINAVLITYTYFSITENYIGKMASFLPYTRPESLLKVLHHIYWHFLWYSCNFFANGNLKIVDCKRFSKVDFWFEVTPKKEIAGRYQKHAFFCATLYICYDCYTLIELLPQVLTNTTGKMQLVVTYLPLYRSVNNLLYTFLLKFIDLLVVVKKIEN